MAAEGGPLSVKVTTWVWEHSRSRGPARLVLLAIADNAHDDGAQAWPSMATLVRKTGLSERTVYRAIRALDKLGELKVDHNAGPKLCNLYRVVMTPIPEPPLSESHPRQPDTPVRESPLSERHPTPVRESPLPLSERHPEPSFNRQGTVRNTIVEQARPGTLPTPDAIRQVWETYLDACQLAGLSVNARLTPKRRDKIRARLKAAPLQDVLDAAQGWTRDPWPERRQHCDAIHIFKSDEQVEKFRDLWRDGPPRQVSKTTAQAIRTSVNMRARQHARAQAEEVNHGPDRGRLDRPGGPAQRGLPASAD